MESIQRNIFKMALSVVSLVFKFRVVRDGIS